MLRVSTCSGTDCSLDIARQRHVVAVDDTGNEHIAIDDGEGLLRLDVVHGTLRHGSIGLCVHLDCSTAITPKLVALDRLLHLLGVHDAGRRPRPADRRLSHLVAVLEVVDALKRGASLRDVAVNLSLAGESALAWPGEGEYLKSLARRRVALARRLINAGPSGIMHRRV